MSKLPGRSLRATVCGAVAALLMLPATAKAEWYEASTKHFVLYADDDPEFIEAYTAALERYDLAMRRFRNVTDREIAPVDRVTIFMLPGMNAMRDISREGVAGFYSPRAGGSVAFTIKEGRKPNRGSIVRVDEKFELDPVQVLRHEYGHHFMFNNFSAAALPMWLTEGFAEFHATAEDMPDGGVRFGRIPLYRAVNFENSDGCSVRLILRTSDLRNLGGCGVTHIYAYGWLATHYFTFAPGGPKKMGDYITAVNRGEPLEKAVGAFGDIQPLADDMMRYLNAKSRTVYTVPAAMLKAAPPVMRKLGAAEAATMQVRIRSKAGVSPEQAPGVYQSAVRAAAPYPNDPVAQLVLAEAAYDAKNYAEAAAAAQRVVTANPKSAKGLVYLGMAKLELARAAKSTDPAVWREARTWFVRANKADPYDADPMLQYFRSFLAANESPTKNAEEGLLQAAEFVPHDRTLLLDVAYVMLGRGDTKAARTALQVIAYNPHGTSKSMADKLIEQVDKGDVAGAMAKIRPYLADPNYRDPETKRRG
jgi:hypothetical protein